MRPRAVGGSAWRVFRRVTETYPRFLVFKATLLLAWSGLVFVVGWTLYHAHWAISIPLVVLAWLLQPDEHCIPTRRRYLRLVGWLNLRERAAGISRDRARERCL